MDNGVVGIYRGDGGVNNVAVIETGDECTILDPMGVNATGYPLVVSSLSLERESFRNSLLTIAAECEEASPSGEEGEDSDWGGIYLTKLADWGGDCASTAANEPLLLSSNIKLAPAFEEEDDSGCAMASAWVLVPAVLLWFHL